MNADVSQPPPDHSGLAARRVLVGAGGGLATAGLALVLGASWPVAALSRAVAGVLGR